MKVKRLIEKLQKMNQDAEVKIFDGYNVLFVSSRADDDTIVVLEDKTSNDLRSELSARYENAIDYYGDELSFYSDLLDDGFTLEDIKENLPEEYEHTKQFIEEHGLI